MIGTTMLRDREAASNRGELLRTRAAMDHLWIAEYQRAILYAAWRHQQGHMWVKVKIPFAHDDDQEEWYQRVLTYVSQLGYERRPGGSSGHGYDLVYFERPTIPGAPVPWAGDELDGDSDGI